MIHYLIDGNNLIGKVKKLSELQSKNKQGAREQVVFLLQDYFSGKKIKVSLHFDGYENGRLNLSNGKIIYSESKTADEKIKDQIASSKNRRNIIVVSSDNGIRDYAKVCGCSLLTSEEFYKECSARNEEEDEEKRIKQMNNIDEFKKLFNVKD